MRKNLPDRKLSIKEKLKIMKHHYEKPDHICDCGCGYHKNTCMKKVQEAFDKKQREKQELEEAEKIAKISREHIIDGGSSFDYETQ